MRKSPFTYRKAADVGRGAYYVCDATTGNRLAIVVRTRRGWDGLTLSRELVVDDYPGSREVAAANAVRRAQ